MWWVRCDVRVKAAKKRARGYKILEAKDRYFYLALDDWGNIYCAMITMEEGYCSVLPTCLSHRNR